MGWKPQTILKYCNLKQEEKKVYNAIDELLWNEWDPLGVNHVEEARDEYCSYVTEIVQLIIQGAERETIANYLFKTETDTMGLFGDIERCKKVSEKVKAI